MLLFQSNRMIFSCAVSFESEKKKIPDLSLPPCIYTFSVLYCTYGTTSYLLIKYWDLIFCTKPQLCGSLYKKTFVHRLNTRRRKSSCGSWRRRMQTCWAAAAGWRRRQLREGNSWRSCRQSWPAQPRSWSRPRTVSPTSRRLSAMCRSVATHWVSTSHGQINYKDNKALNVVFTGVQESL